MTDDLEQVVQDTEIKVVAQLMGGLEPARTIMLKLLESGKDVVTANKALLAEHGPELFDRARELLSASSLSVQRIAELCGYSDAFFFSKQFSSRNGCAPSAWRQAR